MLMGSSRLGNGGCLSEIISIFGRRRPPTVVRQEVNIVISRCSSETSGILTAVTLHQAKYLSWHILVAYSR